MVAALAGAQEAETAMSESSLIVAPDDTATSLPTRMLTAADAQLLRQYRQFLMTYDLREALYCNACFERDASDGCRAGVTSERIAIVCRCQARVFEGQTL